MSAWKEMSAEDRAALVRSCLDGRTSAGMVARMISVKLGEAITRGQVSGVMNRAGMFTGMNRGQPKSPPAKRLVARRGKAKPPPQRVKKVKKPPVEPSPVEVVEVTDVPDPGLSSAVPFDDRKIGLQCAWIIGDPQEAPAVCCGAVVHKREVCLFHFKKSLAHG